VVDDSLTGYLSKEYALAMPGIPVWLFSAGGWTSARPVPGGQHYDLQGPYPLLCCLDWPGLKCDMAAMRGVVSLTFVSDPFGEDVCGLAEHLDLFAPYKVHYTIDCGAKWKASKHHRYYARRSACEVERVDDPDLGAWCDLYSNLVDRHGITGVQAFSRDSFKHQLSVPGLVAFQARDGDEIVGMHLWYKQGDVAYSHLAAFSDRGYELSVAYKLMDAAIGYFSQNVHYIDLGASPDGAGDGLSFFKRGWVNDTRVTYLCGKILNWDVYKELSHGKNTGYFPAYRG